MVYFARDLVVFQNDVLCYKWHFRSLSGGPKHLTLLEGTGTVNIQNYESMHFV